MQSSNLAADRGEFIGQMDPLLVGENSQNYHVLTDLADDLVARSAAFRGKLPDGVHGALSDLARTANCYYSNLIEGHCTHPADIERALRDDYSADPETRILQREARAHVLAQQWIDEGGLTGRAATAAGIYEIHRRFGQMMPDDLLWSENPDTGRRIRIVPGRARDVYVRIGRLIPVSPGAVPRFMARFETGYAGLGKTTAILAVAAAHHRLLWIHPFLDGNGRTARLMSHAMLRETLDSADVWSVARGLAQNEILYRQLLAACDLPGRNDLDGHGHLSEEALAAFTAFFLSACIDQIDFMDGLVQPDRLRQRIAVWTDEEVGAGRLPHGSAAVLDAVLARGELRCDEVSGIAGCDDRQARRITAVLVEQEALASDGGGEPLRPAFPAKLAGRWFPELFAGP